MEDDHRSAVRDHYNRVAEEYDDIYDGEYDGYPSQAICRDIAVERVLDSPKQVDTALDVGCGTGRSTLPLLEQGIDAYGFDFAEDMVSTAKDNLNERGFDPERITQGDINDEIPFDGPFDAIVCLGAVPHAEEQAPALEALADRLTDDGIALVQLRNDLFNAFTLNEHTYRFFRENLLSGVDLPADAEQALDRRLREACRIEESASESSLSGDYAGSFTNPLTVDQLFGEAGLEVEELYFHHYHSMLPEFEDQFTEEFYRASHDLEDPHDWRGYLLASAFLVEAVKR